ncbi:MAG: CRISPR-associated helicase Cas3' [Candidatus Thorarchaeota archaeon]
MVLLAKENESLLDHTVRSIEVLSSMRGLRAIHRELTSEDIHETVALGLLVHDAGKAAVGFQRALLRGLKRVHEAVTTSVESQQKPSHTGQERHHWGYRHEILSSAILSCLPADTLDEKMGWKCGLAVMSHHRDLDYLWRYYSTVNSEQGSEHYQKRICELLPNLPELVDVLRSAARRVSSLFPIAASIVSSIPDAAQVEKLLPRTDPFDKYVRRFRRVTREGSLSETERRSLMLLKGLVTSCDHLASSGVNHIRELGRDRISCPRLPYPHQFWAMSASGSAVLVAPTGLGKTESALLWAKNNLRFGERIFYLLPTTASINKMYERLRDRLSSGHAEDFDLVSVLHHRSMHYLYDHYSSERYRELKIDPFVLAEQARKIYSPLKVTTPFQPLKGLFGVKGYERTLSELAGSLIIVDEIHSYDPHVTGLILGMLKALQSYGVRFFLMSATFPQFLRDIFTEELEIPQSNVRIDRTNDQNARHRLTLIDGGIDSSIDDIARVSRGLRTLIICNTVKSAVRTYESLKSLLGDREAVLLHARFALKDRIEKENLISRADVAVSTQVVEVSLDISYDRMFTEPAPVDALLQRFGRVNRKGERKTPPAEVSVFLRGGPHDNHIYSEELVRRTLDALRGRSDVLATGLTEAMAREIVDEVYAQGFTSQQMNEFKIARSDMLSLWNAQIPMGPGDEDADFYRLFESIEVVPSVYHKAVRALLKNNRFRIPEYSVPVPVWSYKRMEERNLVVHDDDLRIVNIPYSAEYGLRLDQFPVDGGGGDAFVF